MRRRDKHFLLVEVALVSVALSACALSVVSVLVWVRGFRSELASLSARVDSAERTVADASGVAMAAAESMRASPVEESVPVEETVPVRVEGYGQSKTKKRRYIYCDTRLSDGTLQRDIVQWLPLNPENGP